MKMKYLINKIKKLGKLFPQLLIFMKKVYKHIKKIFRPCGAFFVFLLIHLFIILAFMENRISLIRRILMLIIFFARIKVSFIKWIYNKFIFFNNLQLPKGANKLFRKSYIYIKHITNQDE
jgi:hypothetical protein